MVPVLRSDTISRSAGTSRPRKVLIALHSHRTSASSKPSPIAYALSPSTNRSPCRGTPSSRTRTSTSLHPIRSAVRPCAVGVCRFSDSSVRVNVPPRSMTSRVVVKALVKVCLARPAPAIQNGMENAVKRIGAPPVSAAPVHMPTIAFHVRVKPPRLRVCADNPSLGIVTSNREGETVNLILDPTGLRAADGSRAALGSRRAERASVSLTAARSFFA
mmetsp:Transcript_8774/g.17536  ORF Transcript_8774/g.17536 Transcript_8774/m.17536 type:complete len:217 (+) Transcript_8774:183-833(+)